MQNIPINKRLLKAWRHSSISGKAVCHTSIWTWVQIDSMHTKRQAWCLWSLCRGSRNQGVSGTTWPCSLAQAVNCKFNKKSYLKNNVDSDWRRFLISIFDLNMLMQPKNANQSTKNMHMHTTHICKNHDWVNVLTRKLLGMGMELSCWSTCVVCMKLCLKPQHCITPEWQHIAVIPPLRRVRSKDQAPKVILGYKVN